LPPVKLCTTFSVFAAQTLLAKTATAATAKTLLTENLRGLLSIISSPKSSRFDHHDQQAAAAGSNYSTEWPAKHALRAV
jgi:hypothetical protein